MFSNFLVKNKYDTVVLPVIGIILINHEISAFLSTYFLVLIKSGLSTCKWNKNDGVSRIK